VVLRPFRTGQGEIRVTSLWIVNTEGVPDAKTYEGDEYRLGWWDSESQSWRLNDEFAMQLLNILRTRNWGMPDIGIIPTLKIETRS
jgi:hypothetical protein